MPCNLAKGNVRTRKSVKVTGGPQGYSRAISPTHMEKQRYGRLLLRRERVIHVREGHWLITLKTDWTTLSLNSGKLFHFQLSLSIGLSKNKFEKLANLNGYVKALSTQKRSIC